jgi:hypothetical protein
MEKQWIGSSSKDTVGLTSVVTRRSSTTTAWAKQI